MPKRFNKRLYSTSEVCEMLGVDKPQVFYMVKTGQLTPSAGSARKWFFSDEILGRFLGYPEYVNPINEDDLVKRVSEQITANVLGTLNLIRKEEPA